MSRTSGRAVFPHPAFGQGDSHVRTRIGRRESSEFFAWACNAACNVPTFLAHVPGLVMTRAPTRARTNAPVTRLMLCAHSKTAAYCS